ncbi:MAG TPA: hypothetical protein VFL54_09305 [Gammaproteobacteria bacterium]|jgi:hypothetical protein|nr:hypothetical protein [Gammaproteobacteria bacterium]
MTWHAQSGKILSEMRIEGSQISREAAGSCHSFTVFEPKTGNFARGTGGFLMLPPQLAVAAARSRFGIDRPRVRHPIPFSALSTS